MRWMISHGELALLISECESMERPPKNGGHFSIGMDELDTVEIFLLQLMQADSADGDPALGAICQRHVDRRDRFIVET
jgi:hypothetical protein